MSPVRVTLTYIEAYHTYLSWRRNGGEATTARIMDDTMQQVSDSFTRSLPDARNGETTSQALHRTFHDGAFRSPRDTAEYFGTLADLLLPREVTDLLRGTPGLAEIVIRPSPSLAQVPWAVLPVRPDRRLLGELADVRLAVPESLRAMRTPASGGQASYLVLDPKIPGQAPTGPLGSVLGRPTDDDPLAALLHEDTLPVVDSYREVARRTVDRKAFLDGCRRARSLLFVGHVSAAGVPEATAENSTLHLSEPLTAADLLRAGWRAPRRVGLIGCGSGTDLRYPEPFGLVGSALACGAETVIASLWTLPTGGPSLRQLILATDEALRSNDPVRTLQNWQAARARAWFGNGHPDDNPAWWAAPAIWDLRDGPADTARM